MTKQLFFRRFLDVSLFIATVLAVVEPYVEFLPDWSMMVILITFMLLFFTRWWVAENRNAWIKSNWFDLVLVVLLSSPLLRMFVALRVAQFIPALRLGVLLRSNRKRLLRLMVLSGDSLPIALSMMFGTVFVFGTALYLLEHGINPQFGEFQDGLWWAFVTLTTVGYGDIYPVTAAGRVVAVITMIFGIIVYSLVIANMTVFLEKSGREYALSKDVASKKKENSEIT
ncbi:MAG: ion channel [Mariprofundus sp.]|nr:ion channel [Mariprofundus sp.]